MITTPYTFCATVNAIIHAGGTPVLADIDLATLNIDPAAADAAMTPRTAALLPVHFAGRPAPLARLGGIAARHGLTIVDDAAHAFGAAVGSRRIGAAADLTAFSFHAVKNITTGEGGMVTTDRADWAERIRVMALHGMSRDAWARYAGARRGAVRSRRSRLQVQHDGPAGGDRPAAAGPRRRDAGASPRAVAALRRRASPDCR